MHIYNVNQCCGEEDAISALYSEDPGLKRQRLAILTKEFPGSSHTLWAKPRYMNIFLIAPPLQFAISQGLYVLANSLQLLLNFTFSKLTAGI